MFDAEWIIGQADSAPDSRRVRRPGLLKQGLRGKSIAAAFPLPRELRNLAGQYPRDGSRLDSSRAEHVVPVALGRPGSQTWAAAVETMDYPAVAIPINASPGVDTVRLIRVFKMDPDQLLVISIDLERWQTARGRPTAATLGDTSVIVDERSAAVEKLRERLEEAYLATDPSVRDRALRADDEPEPLILVIASDRSVHQEVKAAAATFGMAAEILPANVARDHARLERELSDFASELVAVFIVEPPASDRLVWVADQVRARVSEDVSVAQISAECSVRQRVRKVLTETAAGEFRVAKALTMPTCGRCQPTVARLIGEEGLSVGTTATQAIGECVCEGTGAQNLSIRMRFAVRLVDVEGLIVVGFQPNFPTALDPIRVADVRHIRNAGDANAAASRADLAVVVSGSQMGHSESGPYVDALRDADVQLLGTSGNQLSDVIRVLIDEAVRRRPELRPGPTSS